MSQSIEKRDKVNTIRRLLESRRDSIAMVVPRHLDTDKLMRLAVSSIARNPTLMECTPQSLLRAVLESATLGLQLDGILGHAYLIPYRIKGVYQAQMQPGYKGLMKLAYNSGEVKLIWSRVVYQNDEFDCGLGTEEFIKHVPAEGERGAIRAVYACAKLATGEVAVALLWPKDVMARKNASRASSKGDSPWNNRDWEPEMWKKTAIIQLCKMLPASTELQRAVTIAESEGIESAAEPLIIEHDDVVEEATATVAAAATEASKPKKKTSRKRKPEPEPEPPEAEQDNDDGEEEGDSDDADFSSF